MNYVIVIPDDYGGTRLANLHSERILFGKGDEVRVTRDKGVLTLSVNDEELGTLIQTDPHGTVYHLKSPGGDES